MSLTDIGETVGETAVVMDETASDAAAAAAAVSAPKSPSNATTLDINDWTLGLTLECEVGTVKDTLRTTFGAMCQRLGNPAAYLRTRYNSEGARADFLQWLFEEFPLDDTVEYTLDRKCPPPTCSTDPLLVVSQCALSVSYGISTSQASHGDRGNDWAEQTLGGARGLPHVGS